jgi:tetratricopeptide (TPR) repeat protein
MINLIASLVVLAGSFAGLTKLMGWKGALAPALILGLVAYFLLARWVAKKLDAVRPALEKHIQASRVEEAVKLLESLRPYGRFQFLLGRVLDGQIGILLYAHQRDGERARPYLERAGAANWQARAMLAAYHYRKKRYDEAEAVFESTLKRNRKQSLLWAAYAWCEQKRGHAKRAQELLARAQQFLPRDENISKNLLRLSNDKAKMKMNGYGMEWYALLLEDPPRQMVAQPQQRGFQGRFGRRFIRG